MWADISPFLMVRSVFCMPHWDIVNNFQIFFFLPASNIWTVMNIFNSFIGFESMGITSDKVPNKSYDETDMDSQMIWKNPIRLVWNNRIIISLSIKDFVVLWRWSEWVFLLQTLSKCTVSFQQIRKITWKQLRLKNYSRTFWKFVRMNNWLQFEEI